MQGILDDFWHRPITDVGYVGPDEGEGGRYLILPPDFEGQVPDSYYTFTSRTYNVFVFWRAFRDADGGTKEGVALMEQTRIYPLAMADNPPVMVFPNGTGQPANMLFPMDYGYFEGLAEFVQEEFVGPEDWSMRGMMASLGIAKEKPFTPDARMKRILEQGAKQGTAMARAIVYASRDPEIHYWPGKQWEKMFNTNTEFMRDGCLDPDSRTLWMYSGIVVSPMLISKTPGAGTSSSVDATHQ